MAQRENGQPVRAWLATRLRYLADRLSPETAWRRTGMRFEFVENVGILVHGADAVDPKSTRYRAPERGCWLWYETPDYANAHAPESRYIGYPDEMAKLVPVAPAGKKWMSGPNGWSLVDESSSGDIQS